MPVGSISDGGGNSNTGSVHCLPDVASIHTTGNLADEDWGQAVSSELFVDAEEVDFGHLYDLTFAAYFHGNARNEAVEGVLGTAADSDQPVGMLAGWEKGPAEEGHRVVKAEHSIIILHIISRQQIIQLFSFFLIV